MTVSYELLTASIDIWTSAETEKKSGRGRGANNAASIYGIKKLRELILELAVSGKLVPQDANDEPASILLNRINTEKTKLIGDGKIKKDNALPQLTEQELPFVIPPTWEWVRLGEITNFGSTVKLPSLNNDVWVLDLEDIEKDTSKVLQKLRFPERTSLSDKNYFRKGDVLYGKLRPYLNKVIVADEDGVCTTEILPFRCHGPFNSHYFKVALKSPFFLHFVNERSYGMKMPRLGTKDGRSAPFPLAPLAEQCRIVAKIDELMALCDQLEGQHLNAAAAHEQLVSHLLSTLTQSRSAAAFNSNWQLIFKHFDTLFNTEESVVKLKQTLMELAVLGKLVSQNNSDEPASKILHSIQVEQSKSAGKYLLKKRKSRKPLCDVDSPFVLPIGWAWARFPDLGEFARGKSTHRPRNDPKLFYPAKYPFVQTGEVARAENMITEFHSKYSDIGLAQSKMWPRGTLCITIAANIADAAVLGFDACFPDSVVGFIPSYPIVDSQYFLIFMKTARNNLLKFAPATAQKNINLEILEALLVPLPPLNEMARIISKLSHLLALCDGLLQRINNAKIIQNKLADGIVEQVIKH